MIWYDDYKFYIERLLLGALSTTDKCRDDLVANEYLEHGHLAYASLTLRTADLTARTAAQRWPSAIRSVKKIEDVGFTKEDRQYKTCSFLGSQETDKRSIWISTQVWAFQVSCQEGASASGKWWCEVQETQEERWQRPVIIILRRLEGGKWISGTSAKTP